MNQTETDFVHMLEWIIAQEDIDLQTRQDFVGHIISTGTLDDKAEAFIERYLQQRQQQGLKKEAYLQQTGNLIHQLNVSTADPKTGLKAKIEQETSELITSLAERFIGNFKYREEQIVERAKTQESDAEMDEVAAIKASL